MSLSKRGNVWWCEWRIDGERHRESTYTTDKKEAQEFHDRRRAELWRKSRLGERPAVTWDEAALDWLEKHAKHKKSYADDVYRMRWLQPRLSGKFLEQITKELLQELADDKAEESSNSTANRHLAIVSAVLRHKGLAISIPYLPESKGRIRYLTQPEASRLVKELPKHLSLMAKLTLATGLRRYNVTQLKWENLDLNRRIAWVWADEMKASKPISVPLNSMALDVLNEAKNGFEYVFIYRGSPVHRTGTKAFYAACERAGIENFKWHDLRHTWATWHVQNGTPLEVLQKLGGWADYKMVLKYAHLAPSFVRKWADDLPDLPTATDLVSEHSQGEQDNLGWLMGLEPTTTGITILKHTKKQDINQLLASSPKKKKTA